MDKKASKKSVRKLTEQKKTVFHLVLFQAQADSIDRDLVCSIQEQLDKEIHTPAENTEINIWIESPGGDAHAAYKLILELRQRCSYLQAIVPDYAKSAATLLLLGVDKIYMARAAELGPLDVQIEHPDREQVIVSGLDVAGSLEFLIRTAMEMVISSGATLIHYTGLPRQDVLQSALQFMARFLHPTVAKIDPHLVYRAAKQLKVAERYAVSMLKKRNLPHDGHLTDEQAKRLLQRLVTEYPVHEFVISRDEAKDLGLPVENAEKHPRWAQIKEIYKKFSAQSSSIVALIADSKLDTKQSKDSAKTGDSNEKQPKNGKEKPQTRKKENNSSVSGKTSLRSKTNRGVRANARNSTSATRQKP